MYIGTRTKKLVQTIFLFSTASLCAILFSMAVTVRHIVPPSHSASFAVYTYQNPFKMVNNPSPASAAQTDGVFARLTSAKFILGLAGLGMLWLASVWYLQGGWKSKKPIHWKSKHAAVNSPTQMSSLAVLPARVSPVAKRDIFEPGAASTVVCRTPSRCLMTHRKKITPCQSRFRPVTLISNPTRFGRL